MTTMFGARRRALLAGAAAPAIALALWAGPGEAQEVVRTFEIAPQPLADALLQFSRQADIDIVAAADLTRGRRAPRVRGEMTADQAMNQLLAGSGLEATPSGGGLILARVDQDPQGGSAAGGGATVEALIVTAQKREEDIQDVPIAISAFSQEDLERSQIAGGPDLITQVPNMTFTKTNFSSYSIQIRGIGTQAISATTDPAVAVAMNNTPFVQNRFFEQEFYDLQRVEVLRGPQGTLYGRNATAGVVNLITAKPKFFFEAKATGDIANYNSTRIEGMVNIPLVEDMVALRLAGAWTKREGYAFNDITGNPIDGRDLWSTRVSLRFSPNDRFDANLIWEHFEEDDDRIRSGKQLCYTDDPTEIAGIPVGEFLFEEGGQNGGSTFAGIDARFSQGCAPASLYAPESFQKVNGKSLAYYVPLGAIGLPIALDDPYAGRTQSRDLRTIESSVDPRYRANADVFEFQFDLGLTDSLTLTSETAWATDSVFSTQDYNRFNTQSGAWTPSGSSNQRPGLITLNDQTGFYDFCDPQIGCADRLVAIDLSTGESRQFSQEFRLASDFDGPFNFSLGANFLRFDFTAKYYVFLNSLSLLSALYSRAEGPYVQNVSDGTGCLREPGALPDPFGIEQVAGCTYTDPNPIDNLNDLGHNYFLSKNPYKLISYAVFGETYYNITDNLKVTAGLRWTVDKKDAPRIPSWLLAQETIGYPVADVAEQEWREPTGRLTIDWKPDLSFTNETLLYASYAHGYKAGGANPPAAGLTIYGASLGDREALRRESATKPKTFDPEFIDAFELGAKNTMLDGKVTLNLAAFYYDYKDYQISYITDRSAVNLNFDAEVWGAELEADWRPLENLRLGLKLGYEDTRVADGETAIDVMDRTNGGRPDKNGDSWILVKPFPTYSNNCILPEYLFVTTQGIRSPSGVSGGLNGPCEIAYLLGLDPVTNLEYVENPTYAENLSGNPSPTRLTVRPGYKGFNPLDESLGHNFGEGFAKDLGGNELPNAPHFTATITADYTVPLPSDWLMTLHTDLYYQTESWARIWNLEGYDKLKAFSNVNLAAIFTNEPQGWKVMAFVKNVFDRDNITGSFLNSDDSGLTTNIFLTEPRLYGLRVTKEWRGGPVLGGFGERHEGPYPFTLELGGMVQRTDAPNQTYLPAFADDIPDELYSFNDQNTDLDWGDEREVKLTYAMRNGWNVAAGVRYGKTNGGERNIRNAAEGVRGCGFGGPQLCQYFITYLSQYYDTSELYTDRYSTSSDKSLDREEHTIADFTVGRDVGLGIGSSTVSAGLRYAQFKSRTSVDMYSLPDWEFRVLGSGFFGEYYQAYHHRFDAQFQADREFKGTGPVVTWDMASSLLGSEETGHLALDASVSGGVLFGKQKTNITGQETEAYFSQGGLYFNQPQGPVDGPYTTPLDIAPRDKSVTVPVVGVSLGLSYTVDRFSIGAGYKWERYYDVIDGGVAEARKEDRTIDGPYLKVSVGFGG